MKVLVIEDSQNKVSVEDFVKVMGRFGESIGYKIHELKDVVQFEAKVGSVNQPITHLRELGESFKVGDRLIVLVAKKET